MIYEDRKEFECPLEERLLIYPKERQQYFINMVENYKIFCPQINMIYASLNFNGELKCDYLVIFEAMLKGGKEGIVWDCPFIYTTRAIPAYRYAVKTNQYKEFFDNCMSDFSVMDRSLFYEFLQSQYCEELSLDPNNDKYWMHPNNSEKLLKGLSECGLLYRPSGFKPNPLPKDIAPNPHPGDIKLD